MKTPPDEPYQLTEGPLPRSIYTDQLEDITRKLLMNREFEFSQKDQNDFITIDGIEYNWTEIIQYSRLDHITLSNQDLSLYSDYIKSIKSTSTLEPRYEIRYKRELYNEYYVNKRDLPEPLISFQEMQAINIYTGAFYKKMNALLRGEFDFQSEKKATAKEAIIQSVMCVSGLGKIPETTINETYRGAKMPLIEEHDAHVEAAKKHGVIQLSGFVSSSIEKEASFTAKPVHFHFTHLKGMYVAPISQSSHEKEFLISPTQVQLTGYTFHEDRHCFDGRMVSDLASMEAHSLEPSQLYKSSASNLTTEPELSDITSLEKLRELLPYCLPAHCRSVSETQKDLIKSASDFSSLVEFLSQEQRDAIFEVLIQKNKLVSMIQSGEDFDLILKFLTAKQSAFIFDSMHDKLLGIIKSPNDVGAVLQHLTSTQRPIFFSIMKNGLSDLIVSPDQLNSLFRYLTPEQLTDILKVTELSTIIKSSNDLMMVMKDLSTEQNKTVFELMVDKLPFIIQSGMELAYVMKHLNLEQRIATFNIMKKNLPDIIQSGEDFVNFLGYLTLEQRAIFFGIMENTLFDIIQSEELGKVLRCINPENRTSAFEIMKNKLPSIIQSGFELSVVLEFINPEQRMTTFDIMNDKLSSIIQSGEELGNILEHLNPEQRNATFDIMKNDILNIVQSGEDLGNILKHLSIEYCVNAIKHIDDKLSSIINVKSDVLYLLKPLPSGQFKIVCEALHNILPNIIKSGVDLGYVLKQLSQNSV